jgi:hypothetical protein
VPRTRSIGVCFDGLLSMNFEIPKSRIFAIISPDGERARKTLPGLRSRWTRPAW